jgi:hypothetical protein
VGEGFAGHASYTYLSAKFADEATTGVPRQIAPAGSRLPGVPGSRAYGELSWSHPQVAGVNAALEILYAGKVYANARNTDAAPASASMPPTDVPARCARTANFLHS